MKITRVQTVSLNLPAPKQRLSLTDPKKPIPAAFIGVRLHTDDGLVGIGFTTGSSSGMALTHLIDDDFAPLLFNEDPLESERHFGRAQNRFRSTGFTGLAARAYAAIDIALWDLKAKAAKLPLFKLLGGSRSGAPCFIGDLANLGGDAHQTLNAARPLLEQGVLGVVIEVGSGDMQNDADRVQQIRDGVGELAWLGISVDGRYDLATALAMAHFYEEDVGIDWLDFPIPTTDRIGYRRLAERMEVSLALGSSLDDRDDFRRLLEAGEVRVLRPDPLRMGGITPLLKIVAMAEAYAVSVVPYRLPEVGVHLACGLPNVPMAEMGSWTSAAFASPLTLTKGQLVPTDQPGLGLEFCVTAMTKHRAK